MARSGNKEVVSLDETCGFEVGCFPKSRKRVPLPVFQCCATPPFALFVLSITAFLQGFIVNGLVNASISTLETRFQLSGSEAGLIASCYDIASCLSLFAVTYFGGRGHKPLWLGWGIVAMGLGSIVFSLPHFVAPSHDITDLQSVCTTNGTQNTKACADENLRSNKYAFYVAQLMIGVGATPLYTLGVTYLDENVQQVKSSLYHGIYYSLSIVGPGIGFLLAGTFLSYYTDLGYDPGVDIEHPQFIGAWWLPFLIFGIITMLCGFPMLMFPWQLPGTEDVRKNRQKEMQEDRLARDVKNDENFGKRIKDFPKCFLVIVRNLPFLFISLGAATDALLTSGLATFGPKVIGFLFKVTPSRSSILIGVIAIVGGAGGQLLGGILVFKSKLHVKGMLRLCICLSFISGLSALVFLLVCPDVLFAGATIAYPGSRELIEGSVVSPCNVDCGCDRNVFDPVCGSDGITYYSPCFAGCANEVNDSLVDCMCLDSSNSSGLLSQSATKGLCPGEACGSGGLTTYLILMFAIFFFTFTTAIPGLQATIRIVPFTQRSFAVGVQWLILRLLGSIPGPILFGYALDKTCVLQGTSCDQPGACSVYSNEEVSKNLTILALCLKIFGLIFYGLAYFFYKAPPESPSASEDDTATKNEDRQTAADKTVDPSVVDNGNGAPVTTEEIGVVNPSFVNDANM